MQKLLVDNLIACTNLDPHLVPGLAAPALKGPVSSAANLASIAEHVEVSNLKPAAGMNTSHARPTMLAGISSFVENVKSAWDAVAPGAAAGAFASLPATAKQDFAEWQGMVAAVALSNIYSGMGLSLSVVQMNLSAVNPSMKCVLMEMKKDANYAGAAAQGVLYYICQKGIPFAIFHPEIGLCPMREYDSGIFDGVLTWYKKVPGNCHAGWKDILELDDFCLSRIAWWANNNNLIAYQTYLQGQRPGLPALLPALAVGNSVANANIIDAVWPGKGTCFGTAMMAYLDPLGNPCPMPDLFLDQMIISGIGNAANNRMSFNTAAGEQQIRFSGDGGALNAFAPVPPFKKDIMDLLANCTLNDLTFEAELDGQKHLNSVTVRVAIQTPTGALNTYKTYSYQKLRLGRIPYLMLWPFVPMPSGMNLWKSYYATWHDQTHGLMPLIGANGSMICPVGGKMGYEWGQQGKTHKVFRPTAANQDWSVCVGSAPFRYAVLTSTDPVTGSVDEIGLVFMPDYPTFPAAAGIRSPVTMAVDFGTTSTVCALHSAAFASDITLPFKDYSKCVTCEDATARDTVNTMHWLGSKEAGPTWQWDQKLFSVAQLFDQDPSVIIPTLLPMAANQEYYVDGRLFLASGDALVALAGAGANKGGADPLQAQQIMTDMKFNHGLDVQNYHAASIYLAGIYMYAILYLLSQKFVPTPDMNFVDLRASYPNDVTLDALKNNWNYAIQILNKVMDPSLTNPIGTLLAGPGNFYNESTAATAYQLVHNPAVFANGLVSMDIGGGTTDISISNQALHPGDVRNLSVRYAGREIMVSSLVEFYRKLNLTGPAIVDGNSFFHLWPAHDPETVSLCNQFSILCTPNDKKTSIPFLHSLTNNSTLRMSVEMLLAKGMNLGPAANLNATNLPRQLITMKFIMLLRVAAAAVRENIDIWKQNGSFALIGNSLPITLSVSGTGAQLLQYVYDCNMAGLVDLQTPAVLHPHSTMAQCLNLMNTLFDEELRSVLPANIHTSLRIFVDPNVAQKLDVSYGMLQPGIAALVPTPPAAVGAIIPGFVAIAAGVGGMAPAERNAKTLNMKKHINMRSDPDLDAYITGQTVEAGVVVKHSLMDFWKWYEQIYFPTPTVTNRGLGPDVNVMSSLMEQNSYLPYFTVAKRAVAENLAAFMIEPEQAPYIDQLTGMYLVEEILDWVIAQHQ